MTTDRSILQRADELFEAILNNSNKLILDASYVKSLTDIVERDSLASRSAEDVIRELGKAAGQKVLDFGCGNGAHRPFLEECGFLWHGVDYLPGMAADAARRAELNPGDVRFYDGVKLPFEENAFDAVYSMLVFEHIQHIDLTFGEIQRVLKPGGSLVGQVSYLEQCHDYSCFNFTPVGLKQASEAAGLRLTRLWPKHDAFTFLIRRLLVMTTGVNATELNGWLNPTGELQNKLARYCHKIGKGYEEANLLRLLFSAHFVFHIVNPE